ncbi:carbohydrate esterase family 4 protein [Phycomyces blakesleeanus]|uniref:chitin deacetylase n=2 Tax=Phycomyces blakesleeanus TaxID=4837 RepID=A0A167P2D8_PHYB8|nr:carbohydrate esterase family 4 protein [Phycomyces blakesleeanus NRRL 1555(-)]OAD77116.1 carbohydrate esterase family 4 protein [Phycomyces blakesleeanus NRRL 1555(-)]|eukprot:XP_018295156.1 carbohydrate esterase family 4 protein [Phycomyces blakesleeanus NRRL 1555(-)]
MVWKIQIAALSVAAYAFAGANAAAVTNYTSTTDPTKITIPDITQTTSHDPAAECSWYTSPYTINAAEWPTSWTIATSNGMNTSKEFTALYNSIDWTKAPNIPVRTRTAAGGLDMSTYDTANDPDCWWSATQCVKPKTADINADIYNCPQPSTWGLTFDDGPNCSHNAFYDFLEEKKQKASMFYIGSNVLNWPYGALRGVKDGHHLCGHTWSHTMMTTLTNQEILAELYYTTKAIKYVTGVTPLYWRPAQGDLDDRVRWIATQINLTAILWGLDTDDWAANVTPGITEQTVEDNYAKFIAQGSDGTFANSGNIVLTHEINNMTMDFFIEHYPAIQANYKNILDVATCQSIQYPYVEKSVSFTPFGGASASASGSASGSAKVSGATKPSGTASSAAQSSGQAASAGSSTFNSINGSLFIAALFGLLVMV